MSHPVIETKLELVTESIEALILAVVVATSAADKDRALNHQNVVDARAVLKGSLKEFLQPSLRVVQTQKRDEVGDISTTLTRTVAEHVPYGGQGIDGMNLA
jgi:spore coat polysaccharide biosynthesis protein SpsF (cytidylyltransferase family)